MIPITSGHQCLEGSAIIIVLERSLVQILIKVVFFLRQVLATSPTYADAVDTLSSTDTEADAYFIVGGAKSGEGVVITKSRIGADDLWYMNEAAPG